MIHRVGKFLLPLLFLLLLPDVGVSGAQGGPQAILPKGQPIRITSDRLEALGQKGMVVFIGNATAVQGDRILKADRLHLFYRQGSEQAKPEGVGAPGGGDLERIEAHGRVRLIQGKRVVTGDEAVFDQAAQTIVLTGNAVMSEEGNVVRGHKITVLLNENRGVVEGLDKGRVQATVFPSRNLQEGGKKR